MTLELDGLTRRFGDVVALDDLSFTVPPGQGLRFPRPQRCRQDHGHARRVRPRRPCRPGPSAGRASASAHRRPARSATCPRSVACIPAWWWSTRSSTWPACTGSAPVRRPGAALRLARAPRCRRPGHQQGRGAVARQPAAGAAGRRPGARARARRPRRAAVGPRPRGRGRRERRARGTSRRRARRAVLEPPARPGRGPVRVGGHHRPRPPGGVGNGRGAHHERPAPPGGEGGGRLGRDVGATASRA